MKGIIPTASPRLAAYASAHPETDISCVPGHCYAWKPDEPGAYTGELTHGDDEDELIDKLEKRRG